MKYLLIALACVAGNALACPADGAKSAMDTPSKTVSVAKAKPQMSTPASNKAQTKVAAKTATEPRKTAPL